MFLCLNIAVHSCEVEPGGVHVSFGLPEFAGFSVKANVKTIVYPLQDVCDKLLVWKGWCRMGRGRGRVVVQNGERKGEGEREGLKFD